MTAEHRARGPGDTLALARAAAARAGVTRLGDVTAFGVPGIPVFQATRPSSRTIAVSQGKGLNKRAAMIGALLESVELWSAERIAVDGPPRALSDLDAHHLALWRADGDPVRLALDPARPRPWLPADDLLTGAPCLAPWDLVALDFTRPPSECVSSTVGLATGNTPAEALAAGVAELIEHHAIAAFDLVSRQERHRRQIALDTISAPVIRRLLRRVESAGFSLRAWSMASEQGIAAIRCTMFTRSDPAHDLPPVSGTGCHPDARVAFLRALLEAVQSRASLVAGARDDLSPGNYRRGAERLAGLLFGAMAFGDGTLPWSAVPDARLASSEECLALLLEKAQELGARAVVAHHHPDDLGGLHIAHVLAPGLLDDRRARRLHRRPAARARRDVVLPARRARDDRRILFAGPSIHGLCIPPGIELRAPAACGDLAELLAAPPLAVGLIDGCFKTAPTVWHREIMSLLAAGTRVFGGASLGALRAAELDGLGMQGVGMIYLAYRAGIIARDDAVMLDHVPAELGYAPLTLALVDAEDALLRAAMPPGVRRMMQRVVRTVPYEERDWATCLALYEERTGTRFPLPLAALERIASLKRTDAQRVIGALASVAPSPRTGCTAPDEPAITVHYRAVLARRVPASAAIPA